jgi:hypothetical protein
MLQRVRVVAVTLAVFASFRVDVMASQSKASCWGVESLVGFGVLRRAWCGSALARLSS